MDELQTRIKEYAKTRDTLKTDLERQNYAQAWPLLDLTLQKHGIDRIPRIPSDSSEHTIQMNNLT